MCKKKANENAASEITQTLTPTSPDFGAHKSHRGAREDGTFFKV